MRLALAALFVFIGEIAVVAAFSKFSEGHPITLAIVASAAFFVFLVLAFFLFNILLPRRLPIQTGDTIKDLEEQNLLIEENFQATRAFQIEEFEDEGSHYVIELEDGRVLYLNGQYIYDYEPIGDDPECNQPRTFPCTDFTVRRHKTEGYAFDMICRGTVLEPECIVPAFDEDDIKHDVYYEDGQMISDRSYDAIKAERLKGKAGDQKGPRLG